MSNRDQSNRDQKSMRLAHEGLVEGGTQSVTELRARLGWGRDRTENTLRNLVREGLATLGSRNRPTYANTYTAVKIPKTEVHIMGIEQIYVVYAALLVMVRESRAEQERLTPKQWEIAQEFTSLFEGIVGINEPSLKALRAYSLLNPPRYPGQKCLCLRCGHEWKSHKGQRPKVCPKCSSSQWDTHPKQLTK